MIAYVCGSDAGNGFREGDETEKINTEQIQNETSSLSKKNNRFREFFKDLQETFREAI